ncbi:mitotic checkpoint regulator, MAD2B-interacting-domain-containing protein [Cytidiella melzeri]|nr:mitotic checkpoint regulator, MAD2B-interacting-domain-containing protein [Cytidiella melzeri]
MLGVEGYGSDSDGEDETTVPLTQPSTSTAKPPTAQKKTGLSLLPPASAASGSKALSGLSLPAPKKRAPKKIAIGLPALSHGNEDDSALDDEPPAKKARIEMGAGSSSLFSMLPAPKNANPVPERVLGGGKGRGLVFHTGVKPSTTQVTIEDVEEDAHEHTPVNLAPLSNSILEDAPPPMPSKLAAAPFRPPSLVRGKANINTEDRPTLPKVSTVKPAAPTVDFFSLSSTPTPRSPPLRNASSSLPLLSVSSAPKVDDFTIPEPTPTDPYPGYYLLPSGTWAAHDPAYYQKFYNKWKRDYDKHVRALEKGVRKGFEGVEREGVTEVNAAKEMERAKLEIQEREEKKALTMADGATPAAPKMNIKGAALSGRAKTRHQLSTLLTDAYQNREALEEQIAQARRNRKEAGNKYGF